MSEFPVSLTQSALMAVHRKLASRQGGALRLGVKGGGCSGFSYVLSFEDGPARSTDLVKEDTNFFDPMAIQDDLGPRPLVEIRCDPKSALVLRGTVLDYVDNGLNGRGFTFTNPQERSRCGCGTSFNV